jgi:SAM-dependent methyltransferase
MNNLNNNETILPSEKTNGLGEIIIHHPEGTFALTPASNISIQAICMNQLLLLGNGIDWGCGTGCLAIVAAKIGKVNQVIGLDISDANIEAACQNAIINGVNAKAKFAKSDSFTPYSEMDRQYLNSLKNQTTFILANPPSSEGDDGFEYRRMILRDARTYLIKGGVVFLSISSQYGPRRINNLAQQIEGFEYGGILSSTEWVPFDLRRADLLRCLDVYVQEERRGGMKYSFQYPESINRETMIDAQTALAYFSKTGISPLSKWQTHLFRYGRNEIN